MTETEVNLSLLGQLSPVPPDLASDTSTASLPLSLREDLVTGAEASDMAFVSVSINCNFL